MIWWKLLSKWIVLVAALVIYVVVVPIISIVMEFKTLRVAWANYAKHIYNVRGFLSQIVSKWCVRQVQLVSDPQTVANPLRQSSLDPIL